MKFHTLTLAALGILCSLSSTSHAQKTAEELEVEIMHLDCPPGQKAAAVGIFCPSEARDPLDCWRTRVECVGQSFGNAQTQRVRIGGTIGFNITRKTEEELDYEMQNMECPFGERPAKTSVFCPTGARDPTDCTEEELKKIEANMACPVGQKAKRMFVLCPSGARDDECWGWGTDQYAPSNVPVWTRVVVRCVRTDSDTASGGAESGVTSTPSPTTMDELDYIVQHMHCPVGQRPAKILSFCPLGAKDSRDCSLGGVVCMKESMSNVWGGKPESIIPRRPLKTDEQLDYEMQHMQCPPRYRPAKTSSFCPTGAKDTHDCVSGMVRCVKESISNDWKDKTKPPPTSSEPQKTDEELEIELRTMQCPYGERPAKVSSKCATGAKDTQDCGDAELDSEVANMKCPFGYKPTKVFAVCSLYAKVDADCWRWETVDSELLNAPLQTRVVVQCAKINVDNGRGNGEWPALTSTASPKTEVELNREVAHMKCPDGEKAAKVFAICPLGAKDAECWEEELNREVAKLKCPVGEVAAKVFVICPSGARDDECWGWGTVQPESSSDLIESRIMVKCVKSYFDDHWTSAAPKVSTLRPKTKAELDREVATMKCPFGKKAEKEFAICPAGAEDSECWEWTSDHYESDIPIETRVVVMCKNTDTGDSRNDTKLGRGTPPKTKAELDGELATMKCPVGKKPDKVFAICPFGAKDAECWEWTTDHYESDLPIESRIVVMCVNTHFPNPKRNVDPSELASTPTSIKTDEALDKKLESFGNVWGGRKDPEAASPRPLKTEEELDKEAALMACPVGQNPEKVFALCPPGAEDFDCWEWNTDRHDRPLFELEVRIVVKCVKIARPSTSSLKTEKPDREMAHAA